MMEQEGDRKWEGEAGGWEEAGDVMMGRAERAGEDGRRWRWRLEELEGGG